MAENAETTDTTDSTDSGDATSNEDGQKNESQDSADGSSDAGDSSDEPSLGDAGKKALDAMKAKWKAAEAQAKEQAAALAALQAKVEGTEAEHKAAAEAQRIKDEALAAANTRILKAEVRVQAASKLADPADALRFLDLSEFEVDSDGEVDASLIASAIDDLIKEKPYLAAQGKRFQGSADGGARNDAAGASQLTRDDMKRMSAEAIAEAEAAGRLDRVLGRTN